MMGLKGEKGEPGLAGIPGNFLNSYFYSILLKSVNE
jgi:hypothetical protein